MAESKKTQQPQQQPPTEKQQPEKQQPKHTGTAAGQAEVFDPHGFGGAAQPPTEAVERPGPVDSPADPDRDRTERS